ncbi:MAG: ABC transporter ATP-binding protein [Candidatus Tectomicrobia bacterium]|nr:ABC transporter ATP-binding protein [Candidatus Tectomicrobia bacterium]
MATSRPADESWTPTKAAQSPGQAPAVECERLSMAFARDGGSPVAVLADITLRCPAGEFLSVIGPSGCGKSTLLNVIAGLLWPGEGVVRVLGQEVDGPHPRVGYMFQCDALLPWRTVLSNVEISLELAGVEKKERHARSRELLNTFGLSGFEENYPHQLSGGMRQRVSLARTLIRDPDILLMDEPFASLDSQTKLFLEDELLTIWERSRKTVIFITHDLDEAVSLADRVLLLSSRPARLMLEQEIELPRPRSATEARTHPSFQHHRSLLWEQLRKEVLRTMQGERPYGSRA